MLTSFVTASLLISQPCLAANSNANAGNPFDKLRELITDNINLIEENQGDIAKLEAQAGAINARIDAVKADLAGVAARVATKSADISATFARIAAAEDDIETLRNDLGTLAAQHQNDISALQATLADIQGQINELVELGTALATELNIRVADGILLVTMLSALMRWCWISVF